MPELLAALPEVLGAAEGGAVAAEGAGVAAEGAGAAEGTTGATRNLSLPQFSGTSHHKARGVAEDAVDTAAGSFSASDYTNPGYVS